MAFYPEDVDLSELSRVLATTITAPLDGYIEGKTVLRDRVERELDCSELEAEQIVDTLVARGFVYYDGNPKLPADEGVWRWRER
ncbi:MAG: hypothetical protein DIU78_002420 [Pseudomonadota bacterium]|nr:MAG: hypothetical protein DIU78_02765 [Pseudomonadota bacterium]